MPAPSTSKAGSAELKKVGHTTGKNHGLNPLTTMRGESAESQATPISFGKGK